ncbi:unnamed protein product [Parnassius apollo]|uniref:(apollo) hypothetical protein n=1 Tax=Parnassius apollo TaxID=110799 RepID=A0A8S3W136_PARAO|nr:unnamed protein product [Parnassius apollo]
MTEPLNSNFPEPKKVGVWAEGTHIEAKELVIPKKSPESLEDIPTIPDLDDLQDILEKEISMPPNAEQKDAETVNTLAEVGVGISGSTEGIEGVLEVLMSYVPQVESDTDDTVWTVDSLLSQLSEENETTIEYK